MIDYYDDEQLPETELESIVSETGKWRMSATFGQQIFGNAGGLAGGLAGLYLASRLKSARRVSGSEILLAAVIGGVATIGAVFLIYDGE